MELMVVLTAMDVGVYSDQAMVSLLRMLFTATGKVDPIHVALSTFPPLSLKPTSIINGNEALVSTDEDSYSNQPLRYNWKVFLLDKKMIS